MCILARTFLGAHFAIIHNSFPKRLSLKVAKWHVWWQSYVRVTHRRPAFFAHAVIEPQIFKYNPPLKPGQKTTSQCWKKSLLFALGFCFVLLVVEVNVFLCDLSLHRRLMKVKFVLGFAIAITNSRGFNRWKVCSISFFPRQQPNSDKEMINVGCG